MTQTDRPRVEVAAVSRDSHHRFSKPTVDEITLITGLGVDGDAHAGVIVQHRSRVARDPTQLNLRQVHLIHAELFEAMAIEGHEVEAGQLGENITTRGIDLLSLPAGTRLRLGDEAIVEVTGLRNPCQQVDGFQPGLLRRVLGRTNDGGVEPKGGLKAVVVTGGVVRAGDDLRVQLPPGEPIPLAPV